MSVGEGLGEPKKENLLKVLLLSKIVDGKGFVSSISKDIGIRSSAVSVLIGLTLFLRGTRGGRRLKND
jgi:hypothetical protein